MSASRKRRLRMSPLPVSLALVLAAGASTTACAVRAEEPPSSALATQGATAAPTSSKPVRPYWIELTVAQRDALAPLAEDWERLDLQTKKKWVEISNRYPRMNPDEQGRTQQRMREWALLTPEQRRVARDTFARVRSMNPEQRAEMLRKYQELPPEKRQALASEGHAAKVLVVPKRMPAPVPRRVEVSEGAKMRNPAIAAQKNANPLTAPARVAAPTPKPPATVDVPVLPVSP